MDDKLSKDNVWKTTTDIGARGGQEHTDDLADEVLVPHGDWVNWRKLVRGHVNEDRVRLLKNKLSKDYVWKTTADSRRSIEAAWQLGILEETGEASCE